MYLHGAQPVNSKLAGLIISPPSPQKHKQQQKPSIIIIIMPRHSIIQQAQNVRNDGRGFNRFSIGSRVCVKRRSSSHFNKQGVIVAKTRLRVVVCFDRTGGVGHVIAPSPTRNWVYFWDCEEAPEVPDNVVVAGKEDDKTAGIKSAGTRGNLASFQLPSCQHY